MSHGLHDNIPAALLVGSGMEDLLGHLVHVVDGLNDEPPTLGLLPGCDVELRGDPVPPAIRVKEIALEGPVISYEIGAGGDNLTAIQRHIDAEVAKLAGPGSPDKAPGRKFIVDHIYVRDASIRYGDALSLSMPNVHLRDVGKKSNGASAGEVVKAVWGSIAGGATSVASRAGGVVRDGAKNVLDGARGLFK